MKILIDGMIINTDHVCLAKYGEQREISPDGDVKSKYPIVDLEFVEQGVISHSRFIGATAQRLWDAMCTECYIA